ncbi:hypothetical protein DRO55_04850 [Candidatus Bathyarchaeota archaeon]|nr:MAG: hypothetical protein DRO55_04850 [Candidatus Bathyarchaeota archaeon]
MPYCTRCGFKIPEEEGARFCPNCGAPLTHTITPKAEIEIGEARVGGAAGRLREALSNRMVTAAISAIVGFLTTLAGSLSSVDMAEAQMMVNQLDELRKLVDQLTLGTQFIFGNNLMHCLFMFTPVLGPPYGLYVLYQTGRFIAATGVVNGVNPLLLLFATFLFPHAIMEYVAYGIAISESFWLLYMAAKHRLRAELMNACKAIALAAVLLLAAAFIEVWIIQLLTGGLGG